MLSFIRAKVPLLVIYVGLGILILLMKDLLMGNLLSVWIENPVTALFVSAVAGAVSGFGLALYTLSKNGAHLWATPDEVAVAYEAKHGHPPPRKRKNHP